MKIVLLVEHFWWILGLLILGVSYKLVLRVFGVVVIPQDSIGIVDKKFVLFGSKSLPEGQIIALNGEAGVQADTLAPGLHFFLWPWQYRVNLEKFLIVPQGRIGLVESRAGAPLPQGRVLAKKVECDSFQNTRTFLTGGGERGSQIAVIPPGTYRINTEVFTVENADATEIPSTAVGIVTTKEGKSLPTGDIAGPEMQGHSMFQDGQAFVNAGGFKGLQTQVLLGGRYFIHPKFAAVELKPLTIVPIANVGVVIAYVGDPGEDVTGEAFKHGNLVRKGQRGVWIDVLNPGKYPINPYTHSVEVVPTANVVLNWATGKSEAHQLDKNLSTITVRSSDGFKFNLDVSQIIHIPTADAPKVIARFGNMQNLVTQVLEPVIGNYFRNAAQNSDVIAFLKERQQRQEEARASIKAAIEQYNVGAVDTLIGDIVPPEELMKTLTDRKVADQQRVTYQTQQAAEDERTKLKKATALADTQASVVEAERRVSIADFDAQSAVKKAGGEASAKTALAQAEASVITLTGNATAERTKAVGAAEAEVVKLKIASMEAGNYATIETAKALASAQGVKWVPDIVANGGAGGGESSMVTLLLATLLKDRNVTATK
jgi:uncharacterized membrane protein YqiK